MNTYRVVVGVDGSGEAGRALRWAAQAAAARGGEVTAVAVWDWDGPSVTMPPLSVNPGQARARAENLLDAALNTVRTDFPAVPVTGKVVRGSAPTVLTEAAKDAGLLVLGSHGHGHLHQAVLGSVSEQCVRRATCPVVIVPIAMAEAPAPVPVAG